jgi:hypothetical protein
MNQSFYVGWFTLALINANIAQCKGKSGLFWLVISLLVGPVATLILTFVKPIDNYSGFKIP